MTRLKEYKVTITYPYQSKPTKQVIVPGINPRDAEEIAENIYGGKARATSENRGKKMKTFDQFSQEAKQLNEFAGPLVRAAVKQAAKQGIKQGGKQGAKSVIKQTGKGLLKSPGKAPIKPPLKSPPKIAPSTTPKTTPKTSPTTTPSTPGSKPGTGKKVAGAALVGAAATGALTSTGNKTSTTPQTQTQRGSGVKPPGRVGTKPTTGGGGGKGPGKRGGGFKMPNIPKIKAPKLSGGGTMRDVSGENLGLAKPK